MSIFFHQANNLEPDASTAMVVGSDPSAAASDITYNIGPQVRKCCSDLHVAFFCLSPWAGILRKSRPFFVMDGSKFCWGCCSVGEGKGIVRRERRGR